MVEAVLRDKNSILPVSAYLQGEYGLTNIYIGVPVKLGVNGVKEVLEIELNDEEKSALYKSADIYRQSIDNLL